MFLGIAGFLWAAVQIVSAQSLTVTTVAGSASIPGAVDGTGTVSARFGGYIPSMVTDAAGNLYIADASNFTVRRLTPAGVVTTLAGLAGNSGYVDGTGNGARFQRLAGIARDAAGNLYVGDGSRVRKITAAGVVTTLVAQVGLVGSASSGTSATALNGDAVWVFNLVTALALDAAGNLYVGDFSCVRKILASSGVQTVFAGQPSVQGTAEGVGSAARFGMIAGLAVDAAGNLFVSDSINKSVRKITPAGVVSTFAGLSGSEGYLDAVGTAARFASPAGLAFDATGNLFVADGNNVALRRISSTGVVTTAAGGVKTTSGFALSIDGVGSAARFVGLMAVAGDAQGNVFVSDGAAIRKATNVTAAARIVSPPQNVTAPAAQRATFAITANGNPLPSYQWQRQLAGKTAWTTVTDAPGFAGAATSSLLVSGLTLAMNGDQYRCVVSNSLGNETSAAAVLGVDPPVVVVPLRLSTLAGRAGANAGPDDGTGSAARFTGPMGVTVDAAGNIFVADTFGSRIRKVTPAGVVTTLAGSGLNGAADGVGKAAQFGQPSGIAVDASGNVFVADGWNATIRKITATGTVTTFAGKTGERAYLNGTGTAARFMTPTGLVFDRAGNLIVGDTIWLRKISPTGVVTGIDFRFPNAGDDAPLTDISALAIDAADNVYVACGQSVRKVTPAGQVTTVAGRHVTAGHVDGRAANARFTALGGIALDTAGNIFVADLGANTLRKITPNGFVSTVAGVAPTVANADSSGATDGTGADARFKQPRGLARDRAGNIYVADTLNNTIRKAVSVDAVAVGEAVALSVLSAGESVPASYQWRRNAVAIPGATGEVFTIADATEADSGDYTVEVNTADGAVSSTAVSLRVGQSVAPPAPPVVDPPVVTPPVVPPPVPPTPRSRIVNLSIRSGAGEGAATLAVGFVVSGRLPLLVRGVGPTLAAFGVGTALGDPRLALYAGTTLQASNDNWVNSPALGEAVARLGAFALSTGSLDAALLATMDSGAFTAQCTGASGTSGIALVELYDAATTADPATGRLVNVSARSQVGAGEGILIAGFSIQGTQARSVLIRGVGPTLTQFGVVGALRDPQLRLLDATGAVRGQNDDWADNLGGVALAIAAQSVGAFALPEASLDAAIVATLAPGTYSVQLGGVAGGTGVGLIEIYELP